MGHDGINDRWGWSGKTSHFKNLWIGISNSNLKYSLTEIELCAKSINKSDAEKVLSEYNLTHIKISMGSSNPP